MKYVLIALAAAAYVAWLAREVKNAPLEPEEEKKADDGDIPHQS